MYNIEHHVYFAVFGYDTDALAITLQAGIEADDIWVKGESYSTALPEAVRTDNRWILSSGLDRDASHSDHFEKLLFKLQRLSDALPTLRETYRCGIGVSQYFFMDDPSFYLRPDIIERYQQLGFTISFDQLAIDS
jgi:hypothetical protein